MLMPDLFGRQLLVHLNDRIVLHLELRREGRPRFFELLLELA